MTVEISKFKKEDHAELSPARGDKRLIATEEHLKAVEGLEHSYTVRINGRVVACAGLVVRWDNRAEVWAIIDEVCKKEFLMFHRAARRFLDVVPFRRLEATIVKSYKQGHRWIKLLGFQLEAETMRNYSPTGENYSLYARIK